MSTKGTTSIFKKTAKGFRDHVPDLNTTRFQTAKDQDAYQYVEEFKKTQYPPWIYGLTQTWAELLKEPYVGVTIDGKVREGLFPKQDQGVPIEKIVSAVENVQSKLSESQKEKLQFPLNAEEWRCWSNPEFLLRPFGLRLEDIDKTIAKHILTVIEETFSPEGYQKAQSAMRINAFLGQTCHVEKVMNEYSYNFLLFGIPSVTEPWGWSLYGHHLCLNVFLYSKQIVISPTFTGAEPNLIDEGPFVGTEILCAEGELGLELMQSLPDEDKHKAQIYKLLKDPAMLISGDKKVDRWNEDDQRHVCGAFRDNRIVPYEGVPVSKLTDKQRDLVVAIAEEFCLYLPQPARKMRLDLVREHIDETYFCWIGSWGNEDAFYFRIQSPVIIVEFDHHSGVFLSNKEPAKYHTHTILRTPNAGDYGNALRKKNDWV
ncbi:hypothetical protein BJ878DRAFT_500548, partial [Calycina marina]